MAPDPRTSLPILCLDFDGVLHSYTSPWEGPTIIPDPPVSGALTFIWEASKHFTIAIYSSRSHQPGGIQAMQEWLAYHAGLAGIVDKSFLDAILWPTEKPPAFLTLDDRAWTFAGRFPDPHVLLNFRPWNR